MEKKDCTETQRAQREEKREKNNLSSLRDLRGSVVDAGGIHPGTRDAALEKALTKMDLLERGSKLYGPYLAEFLRGVPINVGSYRRWKRQFTEGGFSALIRQPRSDRGQRRCLPEPIQVLLEGWWLDPARPSAKKCYRRLLAVWPELFKKKDHPQISQITQIKEEEKILSGAEKSVQSVESADRPLPPIPSYATVLAALREIPRPMASLARRGKRHFRDHFEETILRERPELPNQWWVGDHHRFDCFVAVPRRGRGRTAGQSPRQAGLTVPAGVPVPATAWRAVRPWLTAWMDCSNNLIVGYTINLQPNAQEIGLAFRNAILPPSDTSEAWGKLLGGIPKNVLIDNGKDYLSTPVKSLCADLNIAVHHAERYHGQSKPIERWFGVAEQEVVREYPGWCGNSPANRPEGFDAQKLAEAGKLLTLDEFQVRFAQDVHYRIHQLPIEGLGASAAARYQAQLAAGFIPVVPRTEALDLLLLRKADRLVMRWGFTLFGRDDNYRADFLGELIGERVDVLYDPAALGVVKVFFKGVYKGEAVAGQRMAWGTDSADLKEAISARRRRLRVMQEDIDNRRQLAAGISDLELIAREKTIGQIDSQTMRMAVNAPTPVTQLLPQRNLRLAGPTDGPAAGGLIAELPDEPPLSFAEKYYQDSKNKEEGER